MVDGTHDAAAERFGVQSNWGRWGPDDERGTLNLVGESNVLRGAAAVRAGLPISLGRPLDPDAPPYYPEGLEAAVIHEMVTWWGSNAGGPVQAASDQIHVQCHGLDTTHMDALCHIGHEGMGYNGREFQSMVDATGASRCDIGSAGPVVTRAVLLDVPRRREIDHVPGGEPITERDIRGVAPRVRPGDGLLIRTGRARAGDEGRTAAKKYGPISGLDASAMRLISELDVGILGSDGSADNFPPPDDHPLPIHALALVHLGIHLLHNLALEELAQELNRRNQDEFLLVAAPLPIPGGTGSPLAPVAIL